MGISLFLGEHARAVRPGEHLHLPDGVFDGNTTQKADYTKKQVHICPAEYVLTRRYGRRPL